MYSYHQYLGGHFYGIIISSERQIGVLFYIINIGNFQIKDINMEYL